MEDKVLFIKAEDGDRVATRYLRNALPNDVRILVTDLSEAMLEVAKRKLDSHANVEFQSADAAELGFADASVERALRSTYGKASIRAKMQAIVFKAYRGVAV